MGDTGGRRYRRDREAGQNTMEYVGLVVLVAGVVVALVSTGLAGTVTGNFRRAVCRVFHQSQDAACGRQSRAEPLTPLERATRGTYVALGDSYSSGEGGAEFVPGTDRDGIWRERIDDFVPFWDSHVADRYNLCHRSTKAYARRIGDEYDFDGGLEFRACSGATIADLSSDEGRKRPQDAKLYPWNTKERVDFGEEPQLEQLDEDTSLVTLTIGGNDVGFARVIRSCILRGVAKWTESCERHDGARARRDIRDQKDSLIRLYNDIQSRAPKARIVVVGYPRIFPENPLPSSAPFRDLVTLNRLIDPADQVWMNHMARLLDDTLEEAAREAGVEYVDVYDALDRHEIGTKHPWINDLAPELENGGVFDMGSFHPNDLGQAAIAKRVERQVEGGG